MEHELEAEKKRRQEAEDKLFDLVLAKQEMEREDTASTSMICAAEGKPSYSSYSNLLESAANIQCLLDLANEEMKNKSILLRKVFVL